jgi:hypothetical protein
MARKNEVAAVNPRGSRATIAVIAAIVIVIAVAVAFFWFRKRDSQSAVVAEGPPRTIVLITVDTLRADALGYAGNPRVKTPFIDSLAAEGRRTRTSSPGSCRISTASATTRASSSRHSIRPSRNTSASRAMRPARSSARFRSTRASVSAAISTSTTTSTARAHVHASS